MQKTQDYMEDESMIDFLKSPSWRDLDAKPSVASLGNESPDSRKHTGNAFVAATAPRSTARPGVLKTPKSLPPRQHGSRKRFSIPSFSEVSSKRKR
jgi:hypothetical protein